MDLNLASKNEFEGVEFIFKTALLKAGSEIKSCKEPFAKHVFVLPFSNFGGSVSLYSAVGPGCVSTSPDSRSSIKSDTFERSFTSRLSNILNRDGQKSCTICKNM